MHVVAMSNDIFYAFFIKKKLSKSRTILTEYCFIYFKIMIVTESPDK